MRPSQSILVNHENFEKYLNFSSDNHAENGLEVFKDCVAQRHVWVLHGGDIVPLLARMTECSIAILVVKGSIDILLDRQWPKEFIKYLAEKKLTLVVGDVAADSAEYVSEMIDINGFDGWKPLVDNLSLERDRDYLRDFYDVLSMRLNTKTLAKSTALRMAHLFLRNSLINAPLATAYRDLGSYKNFFSNRPILLVASGPSLNKQIPVLQKFKHIFTILSVDTAWPILNRYGIVPDMIFSIDPVNEPSWPWNGLSEDTSLVLDIGCGPRLVWSQLRNQLFSSADPACAVVLKELGVILDHLPTGGSVATSAFNFSRHLGGQPIILIGQDLALTDGKDHAEGYLFRYNEETLNSRSSTGLDVDGYYGGRVRTEKQLLYYKTWYEAAISRNPDLMVINATEGGARINGCLQVPFIKVCEELQSLGVRKEIFPRCGVTLFDRSHLEGLIVRTESLILRVKDYVALSEEAEKFIKSSKRKKPSKIFNKIDKLNQRIINFDRPARILVDAFSTLAMDSIRSEALTDTTEATVGEALNKYLSVYRQSQTAGAKSLAMLQRVLSFYRAIVQRESYDLDLLEEILADEVMNASI